MKSAMAYRTAESGGKKRRETFLYVPRPRGCLTWMLDLAVVVATVALALLTARKQVVSCDWPERSLATCVVHTENAAGMEADFVISGIHAFAYRTGLEIGFVTDAKNKDRDAPFGTRAIVLKDEASANALETFATTRNAPSILLAHGPEHPLRVTGLFLVALITYLVVTRRPAYSITIDREERMLFVAPHGWFGETKRVELADVQKVEIENMPCQVQSPTGGGLEPLDVRSEPARANAITNADVGKHRVRIALKSGGYLPLTPDFSPGAHHLAIAMEVTNALVA
jgi:hypothetical protein